MRRSKIVFVVHRYGLDVNGGAETHCRELAERLLPYYETEVFTSCARAIPWDDYYQPGREEINGVTVRRFPLERKRNLERMEELNQKRLFGEERAEEAWIEENGPYCPALIEYLKENKNDYKVVIFFTYSHYLTYAGLALGIEHAIFVPLAHDEPGIYVSLYRKVFKNAKAFLFNTEEERKFVCNQFQVADKPYRVTCIGIDMPKQSTEGVPKKYEKYKNYIIYIGRVAHSKNYAELNKYFIKYKETHTSDLKLLVLGRIYNGFQLTYHEDIEYLGFVSEEEKHVLIQNAKFLVLPSKTESLSFVILESFALRRPVLVNGYSPVLREQCHRSNAGLYYLNYAEFEAGMEYLLTHPEEYKAMGENGFKFAQENYDWKTVLNNIIGLIEEMGRSVDHSTKKEIQS